MEIYLNNKVKDLLAQYPVRASSQQNVVQERRVQCAFSALQSTLPLRSVVGVNTLLMAPPNTDCKHSAFAYTRSHGTAVSCDLMQCVFEKYCMHYFLCGQA